MAATALTPVLFASASGDDSCDGALFPGIKFATGDVPFSVTTGDFNGDGVSDLATANVDSDDVSVLLVLFDSIRLGLCESHRLMIVCGFVLFESRQGGRHEPEEVYR